MAAHEVGWDSSNPRTRTAMVWGASLAVLSCSLVLAGTDRKVRDLGRADLSEVDASAVPYLVAVVATLLIGVALTLQVPNAVGPLFLGLSVSITAAAALDSTASLLLLAQPRRHMAWLLYLSEASFIPWLLLITWILACIPTGDPAGPRWRVWLRVVAVSAGLLLVTRSLLPGHFSAPFNGYRHPWEIHIGPALPVIRYAGGVILSSAPLVAAASLVVRYRRSEGEEKLQLRWVGFGAAVSFALLLVTAVAAAADSMVAVGISAGLALAVLPISTGIAVSRYRLFELDRLLSRTITWTLVTLVVVGTWSAVVLLVSTLLSARLDSPLAASVATLAAAGAAKPVLTAVGTAVDRRFRRRRWDALNVVNRYVQRPTGAPDPGVESVLALALEDPQLTVAYPQPDGGGWTDARGHHQPEPADGYVVERGGGVLAAVSSSATPALLADVCSAALPELEATGLRAVLKLRIEEIAASRERLSSVAVEERLRLERDLHDGAQQRLLAVLFALESAQRRPDDAGRASLAEATELTRTALAELRDLAHGLRPVHLDQGLQAALESLAVGSSVPTRVTVVGVPPEPLPNEALVAYYVVAEALSNTAKHASASHASVEVNYDGTRLRVSVRDDGNGLADPQGSGLRGILDRAEAARGSVNVVAEPGSGTCIELDLPCA
ncbi:sensor histidine kinase [Nocardioides marmorisolisilvae]|nr:sensor histidine kinase [Nocardioides marmorisolisilvae]